MIEHHGRVAQQFRARHGEVEQRIDQSIETRALFQIDVLQCTSSMQRSAENRARAVEDRYAREMLLFRMAIAHLFIDFDDGTLQRRQMIGVGKNSVKIYIRLPWLFHCGDVRAD